MTKRIVILALLALLIGLVLTPATQAQPTVSAADTFKVVNAKGKPGDILNIKLAISNNTTDLGGFVAFLSIDTTRLRYLGVIDSVNIDSLPGNDTTTLFPNYNFIDRGTTSGLFDFVQDFRVGDSINAAMLFVGTFTALPIGQGNILQFQVQIKPYAPYGSQTQVRIYNPNDVSADPRRCQYSSGSGLQTIYPTLVSGTVDIDTGTVIPGGQNTPPTIAAINPNVFNINTGTPLSFAVSASDVNIGQQLVLSASGLPTGATFGTAGQVVGNTSVTGTFNWTPNASQVGAFVVTFNCRDDSLDFATPRSVTINVTGLTPVGDKIFSRSQPLIGPIAGGTPGLAGISIPVDLSSTRDVYGVQFDFVYPSNVLIIDSLVTTTRLDNFTVYDNIGDTPGRVRVVAFGLNNEKIQPGINSTLLNMWVTVRGSAPIGKHKILFENSYEAISPDPFQPSITLEADTNGIFVVDPGGDVNGDGRVDIADMVVVVGYIIGEIELNLRQFTAADMDRNGFVDVVDLQAIINQVFGGTPPAPGYIWNGDEAELTVNRLSGDGGGTIELNAYLPTDIAGVQVAVHYDPSKIQVRTPRKVDIASPLRMDYSDDGNGRLLLLLYPNDVDVYMAPGGGRLFEIPVELKSGSEIAEADFKLKEAVMTDPAATAIPVKGLGRAVLPADFELRQNYPNPFNPETVIEFVLSPGAEGKLANLTIYNILGQPIYTLIDQNLPAGFHEFKWYGVNNRGEKVSSGVYFYRLKVGDNAVTRKMVLLK